MKKRIALAFAAVAVIAMTGAARQTTSDGSKDHATKVSNASTNLASLSGHVSNDGKAFVVDSDGTVWSVKNPDVLTESVGARVVVRANLDAAKHEMEVIAVRIDTAAGARSRDAAFRR
jgi:hypothetical protein